MATSSRRPARVAAISSFVVVASLVGMAEASSHNPSFFNYTNALENLGVGYNFSCQPKINTVLQSADEYSKAGMNSATTLITLIPALLTIGNLYVPRSSEAFGTSWVVGLLSAAFGLGLPVKSIGAVPAKQMIDLRFLPSLDVQRIRRYGTAIEGAITQSWNWPGWEVPLSELHGWYLGQHGNFVQGAIANRPSEFRHLKARAHRYISRSHWWYLPSFAICLVQLFLLYITIGATAGITTSQPLWSCLSETNDPLSSEVDTTVWWFLVSALVAMTLRALQWAFSPHELVYIHHLPQLDRFRGLVEDPKAITTQQELPPVYHPFRPVESIVQTSLLLWARLQYVFTHPILAAKAAQGRRKPLVVMVHLSIDARGPFVTVFTGFIQGLTLLVLTSFFGLYWGGTVRDTLILLIVLLVVVTIGRLLGLLYVRWSAYAYGFTVIECYSHEEIRGVLRLLASMPDVMVEVNGAQYIWGTRVDGHKEFRRWLVQVEKGTFDDDLTPGVGAPAEGAADGKASGKATDSSVNELRQSEEAMTQHSDVSPPTSAPEPAPFHHAATDLASYEAQGQAQAQAHHPQGLHSTHTWPLGGHDAEVDG